MIRAVLNSPILPRALCVVVVLLMVGSFVSQSLQLHAELRPVVVPVDVPKLRSTVQMSSHVALLFGAPSVVRDNGMPVSQRLSLLACFLQSDAERSIALIAVQQQRPRRVQVGEELLPGVRLYKVEARRVWLSQGGQRVALELQRFQPAAAARSLQSVAGAQP